MEALSESSLPPSPLSCANLVIRCVEWTGEGNQETKRNPQKLWGPKEEASPDALAQNTSWSCEHRHHLEQVWKHRGPGPTPRVSDQQAFLQPHWWPLPSTLMRVFMTHGGHPSACPGLLQVILSQSTAPSPDFSVGLLLHVGVLACVCPEFSLTALSPASIGGIAGHFLVGLFGTCFKRLFSMEIQRPGPRWPDSGLPIKSSVALTSISSFLTGQRGPPSLNFYCSFASLRII